MNFEPRWNPLYTLAIAFVLVCVAGAAEPIPQRIGSSEAIESASSLDGAIVEFEGEAIGDLMGRGDHAWINLSDGNAALGIWAWRRDLPSTILLGSYRQRGDTLLVRGIFHRACAEHGGDLDIHADSIVVTIPGVRTYHPLRAARIALALALVAVSGVIFLIWRSREERSGKGRGSGIR